MQYFCMHAESLDTHMHVSAPHTDPHTHTHTHTHTDGDRDRESTCTSQTNLLPHMHVSKPIILSIGEIHRETDRHTHALTER